MTDEDREKIISRAPDDRARSWNNWVAQKMGRDPRRRDPVTPPAPASKDKQEEAP